MDLPTLTPEKIDLGQGLVLRDYLGLSATDGDIVGVVGLDEGPTIMLGTASGVVKRCSLADLPTKNHHSLISLKDGDRVVGATLASEDSHCVFVTSHAQLLTFPSSAVRPQGLAASGMAGIALPEGAEVIWAGAVSGEHTQVLTLSGSSEVLPGTESTRAKMTALRDFPAKGRATGGVRAHTLLKGEDRLLAAWVGNSPVPLGPKGQALSLEFEVGKRDGSGAKIEEKPAFIGEELA
jgi:DNA gyrase subunit A